MLPRLAYKSFRVRTGNLHELKDCLLVTVKLLYNLQLLQFVPFDETYLDIICEDGLQRPLTSATEAESISTLIIEAGFSDEGDRWGILCEAVEGEAWIDSKLSIGERLAIVRRHVHECLRPHHWVERICPNV